MTIPNDAARHEARAQLALYLRRFPEEAARVAALSLQLADDPHDPFARSNMRGHVTTSALVFDPTLRETLLIHHRVIGRWLQPGGHHEPGQTLWQSALREVAEETGVPLEILGAHPGWGQALPLDIDSHAIAANPRKGEGDHWHHDYAYLVVAPREAVLAGQADEVHGVQWLPVEELFESEEQRFRLLAGKLAALGR